MIDIKDEVLQGGAKYRIRDNEGNILQDNCIIELTTNVIQEGTSINKDLFDDVGFHYGMILMWSGSIDTIPSGWHLCDGTNGTPDLRDRFIVGAGNGYIVGASGGSNSVVLNVNQLPSHTHTVTMNNAGTHNHRVENVPKKVSDGTNGSWRVAGVSNSTTDYTTTNNGDHTHSITIANTGAGGGHENRPPYYSLAYIMKI